MPLHLQRFVEKVLCNHREEFPRIRATICVQKSALSLRGAAAQLVVLACANLDPALVLPGLGQGRRTVDATVEHVELVGELMIDNVVASLGMDGTTQHGVPDQHNRTTQDRLAVDRDPRPLYSDPGGERRALSRRDDRSGIDQDRLDVAVKRVIQAKHQKARKPSNRDPDLVGQRQPAAAFPLFLCDEYLDERAQLDKMCIRDSSWGSEGERIHDPWRALRC